MTQTQSDDLVTRLRGLLAAAVPIPWKLTAQKASIRGVYCRETFQGEVQTLETRIVISGDGSQHQRDANFTLITEAVNALPALLDEIQRLQAQVAAIYESLAIVTDSLEAEIGDRYKGMLPQLESRYNRDMADVILARVMLASIEGAAG